MVARALPSPIKNSLSILKYHIWEWDLWKKQMTQLTTLTKIKIKDLLRFFQLSPIVMWNNWVNFPNATDSMEYRESCTWLERKITRMTHYLWQPIFLINTYKSRATGISQSGKLLPSSRSPCWLLLKWSNQSSLHTTEWSRY